MVLVVADRRAVHVLASAESREAVRQDQDRRSAALLRDGLVERAHDAVLPRVGLEEVVSASGQAGQQEHDRERSRVRAGWHVHGEFTRVRVPERVARKHCALVRPELHATTERERVA